jgi:serine/threonine protein kinase
MSTKNSRSNWLTNLIPGLRRESKSNNHHNNNRINEKIASPKDCLTNEKVIAPKKIEKKISSNYFSNASKNQRFISSTNGSGFLTIKGIDDNSKNMFALSPSNSLENTDFRLKSDYTLIQEEDYNMNENISDIDDIYQEYSGSSIMQDSSSVNLHQTSSSTLSELSSLSSMSVSYNPNKKENKEENISETSSLSNMQSTNSVSECGIALFNSITNEIADKVNLNSSSNDEKNNNQVDSSSSSSDTEYSNNNGQVKNNNNNIEVKKENIVTHKVNEKKIKSSLNVLSRLNQNINKKKNQNQSQNKIKSKVKSKSKNDCNLRSLTMNLRSYNSNHNTSSGAAAAAIYAPEKNINNNNINQYYSNSMKKSSSKKIDIMRNTSKKQYKNSKDSKSSNEHNKIYGNAISYQDIKDKYNESFNKVSHENVKSSSNNNKSSSYSKSKRMDEVKKRKPYYNMENNKSYSNEKIQISKANSNNTLNVNNNYSTNNSSMNNSHNYSNHYQNNNSNAGSNNNNNNNNNINHNSNYNNKNRNNDPNNYNQHYSLRPPAATLAKYRSHSNDFMDRAKKTPYNYKYLMNKNSMNNFNLDNYYSIVKGNNLNNYSSSYKSKPKLLNSHYNDQDNNYNSNSTSSSTLINATTSLSISPKASMSSLDSNSSNNTSNHSYEELNKNFKKSNEAKQQSQLQQEQEKANSEEEERSRRQKEIQALMSGKIHLSKYFTKHYIIGDLLGDGAFGFVLTAIRISDSTEVAIKFISKSKIPDDSWIDDPHIGRVPQEIAILNSISHPNIINFVEYINEEDYILLITELHGTEWDASNPLLNPIKNPGLRLAKQQKPDELKTGQERVIRKRTSCDLFECIDAHTKMTKATTQKIFAQIVLAIYYLHSLNIVHRDLKDENIVIDENYHVKLIDFGSASYIPKRPENYFTRFNGTTHFASPEIVKKKAYRGPEAEIWSLGVLLFTIVFGENPFQNKDEIMEGKYIFPSKIDPECRDLIKKLLTYDEDERITINEVIKHPFIRDEIKRLQITYATGRW